MVRPEVSSSGLPRCSLAPLLAVNLGDDADTTGAIYGQLAGAYYGAVDIRIRKGEEIRDKQTIEAFIRQAGVALQLRHMRKKLHKFEETDKYPGDTHNNSSEYEDIDIRY